MERVFPVDIKTITFEEITWVNQYVRNLAPYIYVREADSLLIKIPNEAFKLNPTGIKLLKHLLAGNSVESIIYNFPGRKEEITQDIHNFFCDLRAVLKGCYNEKELRRSVEKVEFTLPYNTLPVLSEIAITYKCNIACKFCYASCGCKKDATVKDLSTKDLKTVISRIKNDAEVPSVSFTGGEPTLRKDLTALIKHAKSEKMWVNLITNGTLITPERAKKLKEAGLDSSQVSIEAGNASLHDEITQSAGSFEKTLNGIKNLINAGIRCHTNTTISRLNKENLFEILLLVKSLGLSKLSMNMLMPAGSAVVNLKETSISYEEIGNIVLAVKKEAEGLGLEFMWYSPTPICIFNPIVHGLGNKGCSACDGLLSLAPNGDILPCSSYPKPMGNILKKDFKNMWFGADFKYFQEKKFAHEKCQRCGSLAICNGACPLYWEKFGYTELEKTHACIN
ncbi:MAG: radical SAM protein [Candidatus Firestonebacteria bacterium]